MRRLYPYCRKRRGTKEHLDKGKKGEWKSWLKTQHSKNEDHGIWSHHFMANKMGKQWKQWETLFCGVPKSLQMVTAATKLKRCLLLGGKVMTNLDSILKSRDITLQTNVCLVKAVVFPVVRYGCESWTIKKVEHRKIDAFELWYWRRLLRAPWTQGDQSWIFVGRTDAEAETPILWPPDAKNWLIWKDPDAGKDWRRDDRGWDGWIASSIQWTWVWVNSGSWWCTGKPGVLQCMGVSKSRTRLSNWTELKGCQEPEMR